MVYQFLSGFNSELLSPCGLPYPVGNSSIMRTTAPQPQAMGYQWIPKQHLLIMTPADQLCHDCKSVSFPTYCDLSNILSLGSELWKKGHRIKVGSNTFHQLQPPVAYTWLSHSVTCATWWDCPMQPNGIIMHMPPVVQNHLAQTRKNYSAVNVLNWPRQHMTAIPALRRLWQIMNSRIAWALKALSRKTRGKK